MPLLLQAACLAARAEDPSGITKAIKSWKGKTRKDNVDLWKGREQEGPGECQKSQRRTFWLYPHCAVIPGREPGFIPVLPSIWTLFTVVLEESGLKLSFCSGRENFLQINAAESGKVMDPSPGRQHPSLHQCN